ncbi:MAG TPA: MerR family transcriptional regulator [Bryobacteraceae bacterium]|nr:MerR family transcriptional regulator [Bryobacteraceae bacterium]
MEEEPDVTGTTYRTREFAELAGVTVRTLHHYDRLGLLRPGRRSAAGYRLYDARDLERLEQIVALKCLGLPLKQIRSLVDRTPLRLEQALRTQRRVLQEKRRLLDHAIAAIEAAEAELRRGGRPDTEILKTIIEAIEMQNNTDYTRQYYSAEAQAKLDERAKTWSPELQAKAEQDWSDLFRDIEAALGEDPEGPKALSLADRWLNLLGQFTGGDPRIVEGLRNMYADRDNWPDSMKQRTEPWSNPPVRDFINKAIGARKRAQL